MTEAAIYERISGIRAELLEVIGKVGSSNRSLELEATVMEDDLIMVANRLGRVAGQLQPAALVRETRGGATAAAHPQAPACG